MKQELVFDIQVALLGHVSVGKTTVLNSLLRGKFAEVSMRRTTAAINHFRLSYATTKRKKNSKNNKEESTTKRQAILEEQQEEEKAVEEPMVVVATNAVVGPTSNTPITGTAMDWSVVVANDEEGAKMTTGPSTSSSSSSPTTSIGSGRSSSTRSGQQGAAKATLAEITADNAAFRESDEIHVKSFDIELDNIDDDDHYEPLCEMRPDTRLVLVDIPGVNEAGAGGKYKKYVEDHWDTFDCVVVVMDGRQGANTEEQVNLLEFVQTNNAEKKNIPVIILCNKVDDPEDEEQGVLVQEMRLEIERVFGVSSREKALEALLNKDHTTSSSSSSPPPSSHPKRRKSRSPPTQPPPSSSLYPVFIPTSAIHAFIYQTASLMTLEQFKSFDKELIEKLGREEVGKWEWRKLSQEDKYKVAHGAVSNSTQYRERLEATNFDKFLAALARTVGGSHRQLELIEKQLEIATKSLSPTKCVATQIRHIYEKRKVLGHPTSNLKESFWATFVDSETIAFELLQKPTDVHLLQHLLIYLSAFWDLCKEVGWLDQKDTIISKLKGFVRRQISIIFNEERFSRNVNWYNDGEPVDEDPSWGRLSPEDWKAIIRSVLTSSCKQSFFRLFCQEKILTESLLDKIIKKSCCYICAERLCDCGCENSEYALGFRVEDDLLDPVNKNLFSAVYQISVPESIEDPQHWGYITWKVCDMIDAMLEKP